MAFSLSVDQSSNLQGYSPLIGEVPNPAQAVVYTVPAGKNSLVASVEVLNASGGTANVTLYINVSGVAFPFTTMALLNNARNVNAQPRNFPEGGKIEAKSDVSGVTYIIQIKEYTP